MACNAVAGRQPRSTAGVRPSNARGRPVAALVAATGLVLNTSLSGSEHGVLPCPVTVGEAQRRGCIPLRRSPDRYWMALRRSMSEQASSLALAHQKMPRSGGSVGIEGSRTKASRGYADELFMA